MWFFSKDKETRQSKAQKKLEADRALEQEHIANFKAFRAIGAKFQYMGIEMIVESHFYRQKETLEIVARIAAAYRTTLGELKYATFYWEDFPCLLAENPISSNVLPDSHGLKQ